MPAQVRAAEWARDMDAAAGEVMAAIRRAMAGPGAADDWEPLRRHTWAPRPPGFPVGAVWGFTPEDWGQIRSALGRRFGAGAGARLTERLVRLYGDLRGFQMQGRPVVSGHGDRSAFLAAPRPFPGGPAGRRQAGDR